LISDLAFIVLAMNVSATYFIHLLIQTKSLLLSS